MKKIIRLRFYNAKGELRFLVVGNEVKKVEKAPPTIVLDKDADCALIRDVISKEEAKMYSDFELTP